MAGKREENPAGSSNNLRGDVLRVLGVLKVVTVEQMQQISAPHLSYRHTDKPTPAERKQARTASHTGALSDLRKHGLAENGGQLPVGDRLRNLTPMGLKAAARELGRPVGEMGDPARGGAGRGQRHLGRVGGDGAQPWGRVEGGLGGGADVGLAGELGQVRLRAQLHLQSEGLCNVAKSGGSSSTSGGWSYCCQGTKCPGSR
ncbi:hypothetical protein ACFZAB_33580 [Streptomyces albogriseolus]|uniref:hypothetical protein n=1 Tax=Streptomyces albogriseolus TaxID=1887 RepID=UPI0022532D1B|nr:hypothetical protein [Streptomyces viridodiastaticus]MCX4618060.1 hypothetical protein [Streptomyces viridodiastaticus]